MAVSKKEIFTERQNALASFAKALGHPARIAILEFLIEKDQCICGDIVSEIGLSQSTISQHLAALKKANIIQGNIDGTKVCYCINKEVLEENLKLLNLKIKAAISNCC